MLPPKAPLSAQHLRARAFTISAAAAFLARAVRTKQNTKGKHGQPAPFLSSQGHPLTVIQLPVARRSTRTTLLHAFVQFPRSAFRPALPSESGHGTGRNNLHSALPGRETPWSSPMENRCPQLFVVLPAPTWAPHVSCTLKVSQPVDFDSFYDSCLSRSAGGMVQTCDWRSCDCVTACCCPLCIRQPFDVLRASSMRMSPNIKKYIIVTPQKQV